MLDKSAAGTEESLRDRTLIAVPPRGMYFIFEVRIRPGHTDAQYAAAWIRASEIIQRSACARGTRLHRRIGEDGVLIAIASWDSKEARDEADAVLRHDRDLRAVLSEAAEHAEITIIGEFEEPEWVVLPPEG